MVARLQQMGFVPPQAPAATQSSASAAATNTEQEKKPEEEDRWANWRPSDWRDQSWEDQSRWQERDRPYIAHLEFPTFDGRKEAFNDYRYTVRNLLAQCVPKDHKYLAPRLISNFKGAMSDDVRSMELNSSDYLTEDGVERLLDFIKKRLNIRDLDLETEVFQNILTT